MAKVTIEDVSRRTGLSRGTVSRALNNRPDISEQTRQRVLAECRKLNYVPSRAARSLATGRNYAVAVVVDDLHATFSADLLSGAIEQAARSQYAVNITYLPHDQAGQVSALQGLSRERTDATLLAAPLSAEAATVVQDSFADAIIAASFPVEGVSCDVLMPDSVESGRLAAKHVCRGAANNDVLYVHNSAAVGADGRLQGFQSQCGDEGLDPEAITLRLPTAWRSGRPLAALTDRISKAGRIAASDDFTAVTIMFICQRLGRTPGEDVAVMGQANERVGALISPGLTTIDLNGKEVGRRAMEILLARVEETRLDAAQTVAVAPRLVARESTRHLS